MFRNWTIICQDAIEEFPKCFCPFIIVHPLDGFSTTDVEYIWKRDEVRVEQPTMAQFSITSSKTSRTVAVYITGKVLNSKYSF